MLPEFVTSLTSLGNTRKALWHKALEHKKILLPKQEKNSVENNFFTIRLLRLCAYAILIYY